MKRIIGLVNYTEKNNNYTKWLKSGDPDIEFIMLNHEYNNAEELLKCSGLVLSGGADVNPDLYGEDNKENLSKGIDNKRDALELALLKIANSNQIPTLGICRGLQIGNVFRGGSLLQHINYHLNTSESKEDLSHRLKLTDNSLLYQITNKLTGIVNSAHHQAPKELGSGLIATAFSSNGIKEALELEERNYPYLSVQWHPERMVDKENNKFSYEILNWFLNNTK